MTNETVAAFEVWRNGKEFQTSPLFTGDDVQAFVQSHEESGTFAELLEFTDLNQAVREFNNLNS